jgi:hypothetical protein
VVINTPTTLSTHTGTDLHLHLPRLKALEPGETWIAYFPDAGSLADLLRNNGFNKHSFPTLLGFRSTQAQLSSKAHQMLAGI